MWHFLNSNSGAVQASSAVIITILTVVLARATILYVQLTKQIAIASVTQAEAVHKPVLTLKQVESPTSDLSVADMTKLVGDVGRGRLYTSVGRVLEIVNIGTGPALQVRWTLKRFSDSGGFIPYIEVGQAVSLRQVSKVKMGGVPTSFQLECRYKSLSGTKYVSVTHIENSQEVSNFEVGLDE